MTDRPQGTDHFGIGVGVRGAALVYFHAARGSGRTTSLVDSVKTGDRIVFADPREARRVSQLCNERGVVVECIVIDPSHPEDILHRRKSDGRTIFDHSWLEMYYLNHIERCQNDIAYFEHTSSGGEGPQKTLFYNKQVTTWGNI